MKILAALFLAAAAPLYSHVGSPDVYYEGSAGPYRLLVTIRPPEVVPGVAEIGIRSAGPGVERIRIAPLRLEASKQFSPVPDVAEKSKEDPHYFTGTLWLMSAGEWKVLVKVEGTMGTGELAVPVPALSTRVLGMQKTLGAVLIPLGLILVFGLAAITAASAREAQLEPGVLPDARGKQRGRVVMIVTLVGFAAVLYFANLWWTAEANEYARIVYKPLQLDATVQDGNRLLLKVKDPGWLDRGVDDFVPDHGHLMHLFIVNLPAIDRVWHLHPEQAGDPATFLQSLPDMPAGHYALYGDVVHSWGLGETATAKIDLPEIHGVKLSGDDASGGPPVIPASGYNPDVAMLPGGYRMLWEHSAAKIHARQPYEFRFRMVDPSGSDAKDVQLYMGMQGHAAFLKDDGSVFAHVHPSGTVPAPALGLAMPGNEHAMHMPAAFGMPAQVTFPYGLPKPGAYRIFVQMKRGGEIMTGSFKANVEN
jgi:hypothetical protein